MATSEDIPSLILEDESADKLIQRVIKSPWKVTIRASKRKVVQ